MSSESMHFRPEFSSTGVTRVRSLELNLARTSSAAMSFNLDFLRSAAVLLVVGFHLAKCFNWRFGSLRVTDLGLLGVMLFFVHTTLVLMFSLERQWTTSNAPFFLPFMLRRCFRIYPLAILVVTFAYLLRIPSDLEFGRFSLLQQNSGNLIANLLLIHNVTLQKANPGPLWSLPLEIQMYLFLPGLFVLALRVKSSRGLVVLWCSFVALWFSLGYATGMLPLSQGGIRSPAEALLKLTQFVPCFLPGIIAYKLWRRPRLLPGFLWPVFLLVLSTVFVLFSGSQPIQTGWFICFGIGLGAFLFRELHENFVTRLARGIARYSYGVYLLHYFAIWFGFVVCRNLNFGMQIAIFGATLASLAILLYHTVESPLIAMGVNLSERLKPLPIFQKSTRTPPNRVHATVLGWSLEMHRGKESNRRLRIFLAMALIPAAGSIRAQGLPAGNRIPITGVKSTQDPNQRLPESSKPVSPALAAPSDNESRIGPDDLLDITVFEAPDLNRTLRVSANGEISFQLLGAIKAGGLTPQQLELILQESLRHTYMKDPHVGVFVRELQSHPVSVVGAVRKPGVYQIRGTKTVLELLSMAEGLADDAGDTVLVMRGASLSKVEGNGQTKISSADAAPGEIVEINIKSLMDSVDPAFNLPVHPGDIVKIPRAGIVYVVGEVKKPGGFVLKNNENITVLQALALAEGLTRTSLKSQARIIRTEPGTDKRIETPIDLGKILSNKSSDTLLQPNDVLFVPDSSAKSAFYRGAEAVLSTATGVAIYRW